MYNAVLSIHNVLRWLVVIAAVVTLVRMYTGWFGKKKWTPADDRVGVIFTSLLDLQLLVGLVLYFFLSPTTTSALRDFGSAMNAPLERYFAVEHSVGMVMAIVLAHVGRSLAKKVPADVNKFSRSAIWFTLAVIVLLVSIPWPFSPASRPWLRLFGLIVP
jgi:hypothetical protein